MANLKMLKLKGNFKRNNIGNGNFKRNNIGTNAYIWN